MSKDILGALKASKITAFKENNSTDHVFALSADATTEKQLHFYNGNQWKTYPNPSSYLGSALSTFDKNPRIIRTGGTNNDNEIWHSDNRNNGQLWNTDPNDNPGRLTNLTDLTHKVIRTNPYKITTYVIDASGNVFAPNFNPNSWNKIYHGSTASKAISISANSKNLYMADHYGTVYKRVQLSGGAWTWLALTGDRKAIKVAVSEHFVCIIDRFNQICIHNGSYWEVLEEYGLAIDIAVAGTSMYMIDKFDKYVYKISAY